MYKNTVTLAQIGNIVVGFNTVTGYSPDNDPALIVHKDPENKGWNITHKSGWAVIKYCRTREIALIIAEELGRLANWHNITTENAMEWYATNKDRFNEIKAISRGSQAEDVKNKIKQLH
jgi:hypothetical protein